MVDSDENTETAIQVKKFAFGWFMFGIFESHSRLYLLYIFIIIYLQTVAQTNCL